MRRKVKRFGDRVLSVIRDELYLRIRAGSDPHRFIGIWAVVVGKRVFVRSWYVRPDGWYGTSLRDPVGVVKVAGREIPVRTLRTRSERLNQAIDRAYLDKYHTKASLKWARGLARAKSRATTTELRPS